MNIQEQSVYKHAKPNLFVLDYFTESLLIKKKFFESI